MGIDTSYKAIFKKMMEKNWGLYKDAESLVDECKSDLEHFIGRLLQQIDPDNKFLRKYVANKVKYDFMQSTHEIVKSKIKNVYALQNNGIHILFQNFTNFFTLNYDPFLYLFLLHFKAVESDEQMAVAVQANIKFIEEDLNDRLNNIYKEIKSLRETGTLEIKVQTDISSTVKAFNHLRKTRFTELVKEYSEAHHKSWSGFDINSVVDRILEEEKTHKTLNKISDGAQYNLFGDTDELAFNIESETQNLFFLHGAFHIYRDGELEKKITQQSDKALYERLESILNSEDQEIVCVFQSDDKLEAIEASPYLLKCLNKLSTLQGNLVIIGSSLAENDNHIFDRINESEIEALYISTLKAEKDYQHAIALFPSKTIYLFDAGTISYELPQSAAPL